MANPVNWFHISVKDVEHVAKFYGEAFDWKIKPGPDGMAFADTGKGGIPGGIAGIMDGSDKPSVHIYIGTDSIEKQLARIERAGGKVAHGKTPLPRAWGGSPASSTWPATSSASGRTRRSRRRRPAPRGREEGRQEGPREEACREEDRREEACRQEGGQEALTRRCLGALGGEPPGWISPAPTLRPRKPPESDGFEAGTLAHGAGMTPPPRRPSLPRRTAVSPPPPRPSPGAASAARARAPRRGAGGERVRGGQRREGRRRVGLPGQRRLELGQGRRARLRHRPHQRRELPRHHLRHELEGDEERGAGARRLPVLRAW